MAHRRRTQQERRERRESRRTAADDHPLDGIEPADADALPAAAALDLARSELAREAAQEHAAGPWPDDEWDGWAHVHAAFSLRAVVRTLPALVTPDDGPLLRQFQDHVAEPVRSWLATLVERATAAA